MKKWKCNNCGLEWGANAPICCPGCGSSQFSELASSGGASDFLKKFWWAILLGVLAIAFIVFFVLRTIGGSVDDVIATAEYDERGRSLAVNIDKGEKEKADFKGHSMILEKSGKLFLKVSVAEGSGFEESGNELVFFHLFTEDDAGEFTVKFISSESEKFKIELKGEGSFTVEEVEEGDEELPETKVPVVTNLRTVPENGKLTVENPKYKVFVEVDENVLPISKCEFSIDGENWQYASEEFTDVAPGEYMVYVRNAQNPARRDEKELILSPPMAKQPTKKEINDLLSKLSRGDDNAYLELNKLGGTTKVVCATQPNISNLTTLSIQAYTILFEVTDIKYDKNRKISTLIVREK